MNKTKALTLLILITFSTVTVFSTVKAQTTPNTNIQNTWTTRAAMPTPRYDLGVAVVDGKIYAIGGFGGLGSERYPNVTEQYDPQTDTWTTKSSMPTARGSFSIAACQGKIYCIGGYGIQEWLNTNEAYDPASDTWTSKPPMPTAINLPLSTALIDGKIYILGMTSNAILLQVYDPTTETWNVTSPPTGVDNRLAVSATVGNNIYFADDEQGSQIAVFDTATNSWSLGGYPPSPVWAGAAAATSGAFAPIRIYVLGVNYQIDQGIMLNRVYNPKTGQWTSGALVPTNRQDFAIAVLNDTLYVIGGRLQSFPLWPDINNAAYFSIATNEQYIPVGYGTPDPTYQSPSPTPSTSPISTPPLTSPTPTLAPSPNTTQAAPQTETPSTSISTLQPMPTKTVTTQPITSPTGGKSAWQTSTIWIIAASVAVAAVLIIVYAAVARKRKNTAENSVIR